MVKRGKFEKNKINEYLFKRNNCSTNSSCGGIVYGLGFIGSAVYYINNSNGFWNGFWGVIKSLVWPATLVYELFKYLGV